MKLKRLVLPLLLSSLLFTGCSPKKVNSNNSSSIINVGLNIENDILTGFDSNSIQENVIIPDGVKEIAPNAFLNCYNLKSITIPNSVTKIGNQAFYGCEGLTSIIIPDSVTSFGNDVFSRSANLVSITLPLTSGMEDTNLWYYFGTFSLREITITKATSIGNRALENFTNLTSITLPDGITSIGKFAFTNCSSLPSITIPDTVTSIGNSAFSNCGSLSSITLPAGVISIEDNPMALEESIFYNCSSLTEIKVDSDNTVYDSRDNCNAIIKKDTNKLVYGCKNTVIPNTVTCIGRYAFIGCTGLSSLTIPNSVKSIEMGAFYGCSGLTSITIPKSVSSIGCEVFARCGLESITFQGNMGEWEALEKNERWNNNNNIRSITCNDGTITL